LTAIGLTASAWEAPAAPYAGFVVGVGAGAAGFIDWGVDKYTVDFYDDIFDIK
jgi:hypothetical protein